MNSKVPSQSKRFQETFYGRRQGRALRPEARRLLNHDLGKYQFTVEDVNPDHLNWLEIGFGCGEHLIEQAKHHPDIHFFGAEAFINGVTMAIRHVVSESLCNVRIWPQDVRPLLDALPDHAFDRIFLLFPDPWPKMRHHKRRFVSPTNLARIKRILKPGGAFHIASDHCDYVAWIKTHLQRETGLIPQFNWEAIPTTRPDSGFPTRYEEKALRQGKTCFYMEFLKS